MPSKGVTKSVREVVNPVTGKMCTGKDSVEVINSFFTNIGPNLNNKLPPSSDTNTIQESDVSLENIVMLNNENVAGLVKDIDICKSSGVSDVPSRLLIIHYQDNGFYCSWKAVIISHRGPCHLVLMD